MPEKNESVQLGCGTLILIALIVLIVSGESTKDMEREVKKLSDEVEELHEKVDYLTGLIEGMDQSKEEELRYVH